MSDTKKQEAINTFSEKMAINRVWLETNKLSKIAFAKNQEMFTEELANTCERIGIKKCLEIFKTYKLGGLFSKQKEVASIFLEIDALLDPPEGETITEPIEQRRNK